MANNNNNKKYIYFSKLKQVKSNFCKKRHLIYTSEPAVVGI